ncbi:hypothetical protein EVAR_90645_1 [Eumeta japonica]|uniref:Reverse transcriptase domain-containing protein n=2 Tax=Eumeta variegata TaxID=151549 RepID=A0A4C1T0Y1_EUMVA|nr:hypothetical protein EVAR_90645_1 [Eumeta japonica]
MKALVNKGYAERGPLHRTENRTWYLPHFPVINAMKPGKIRVVHDAAAKTKGVSLNDHLLTGPDLLQSLPGVIMRFRQHPVAVSADISEMFMQIKIKPEDRDALRYLWRGDKRGNEKPTEYRMTSLIFGATSSPATSIYIKNFNAEKYRETEPEVYRAVIKNHYVDDYIQSFETEQKAIDIAQRVRDVHREARFELKQWTSNSKRLLTALNETSEQKKSIDLHTENSSERVLGLNWNSDRDELTFNLNLARLPHDIMNSERPTKRQVLKIVMSLFDPLGLASPVTTKAKQLLQKYGGERDGLRSSPLLASDRFSRSRFDITDNSQIEVAPLKITSIPRLELQAAVMGTRMATTVIEEHDRKPNTKFYWTDSKTVLTWLKNGARSYKPFVAHRIAAIEENSTLNEWRWVPTKQNVADDATRNVPRNLDRWYNGPEFLQHESNDWPTENLSF